MEGEKEDTNTRLEGDNKVTIVRYERRIKNPRVETGAKREIGQNVILYSISVSYYIQFHFHFACI